MTYPVVTVQNEDGTSFQAYEAKIEGKTLHIEKELVDAGLTTMEAEIKAMQEAGS